MSWIRNIFVALVFFVSFAPFSAQAQITVASQDLAVTDIRCESGQRITFSVVNFGTAPSGTYRIAVTDISGRDISNFGPQSSLSNTRTVNATLELTNIRAQTFRVTVDPGNLIPDRNPANNSLSIFCGAGAGSSSGSGSGQSNTGNDDCREIEVLGIPVTVCQPGSNPPPVVGAPPIVGNGFDLAVVQERCSSRRVTFEVQNIGRLRSDQAQVVLLDANTNRVLNTWQVQALRNGEFLEFSFAQPRGLDDFVVALVRNNDDDPGNDTVSFSCRGNDGGSTVPPPTNFGPDISLDSGNCRGNRLRFTVSNDGAGRTPEASVILIDPTDTVVSRWDVRRLGQGESITFNFRPAVRGDDYRVALLDANDANFGNNFIFFTC